LDSGKWSRGGGGPEFLGGARVSEFRSEAPVVIRGKSIIIIIIIIIITVIIFVVLYVCVCLYLC
jgi:hypothetical protein